MAAPGTIVATPRHVVAVSTKHNALSRIPQTTAAATSSSLSHSKRTHGDLLVSITPKINRTSVPPA